MKVWDKDAVRVEVSHSDREVVDIKPGDQVLKASARARRAAGPAALSARLLDHRAEVDGDQRGRHLC